jgi:putative transcriptional regulator
MHKSGLLTKAARDKITMRHLGGSDVPAPVTAKISGPEIKAIREKARLSQAVFARYLNVTAGYVSQLERGDKRPIGPALVLLNVIRRKGIEAIL